MTNTEIMEFNAIDKSLALLDHNMELYVKDFTEYLKTNPLTKDNTSELVSLFATSCTQYGQVHRVLVIKSQDATNRRAFLRDAEAMFFQLADRYNQMKTGKA